MSSNPFITSFSDALLTHVYDLHTSDNVDPHRYPEEQQGFLRRLQSFLRSSVQQLAHKLGYVPIGNAPSAVPVLSQVICRSSGLNDLYESLGDEDSRRMLVEILTFRVLGYPRVKLPQNQPSFWAASNHIDRDLVRERRTVAVGMLDGYLNKYDLRSDGFPITLHAHHLNIQNTFSLQQYGYTKNGKSIQAEAGDVVIDGGGCWGDTALYFAHRVGPAGQVICFEFVPENLKILRSNLELNPELGPRVKIAENALWDRSGDTLNFHGDGPGTSVLGDQHNAMRSVQTLSIDSLVEANGLQKVDFIKLDIEGAEPKALKGAEQTIRRFRPKLAVSLYHSLDDFVEIPAYLRSLGLGYEFYLDHFTIHHEETVLFAR